MRWADSAHKNTSFLRKNSTPAASVSLDSVFPKNQRSLKPLELQKPQSKADLFHMACFSAQCVTVPPSYVKALFYGRRREKVLYKPIFAGSLPRDSGRAGALSQLLASVRRQGVRAEGLLKDADNLTQRYKKLEARLQQQAQAQNDLEGQCEDLSAQAESTRTWITQLLGPLDPPDPDVPAEEMKKKAQVRTLDQGISRFIQNMFFWFNLLLIQYFGSSVCDGSKTCLLYVCFYKYKNCSLVKTKQNKWVLL